MLPKVTQALLEIPPFPQHDLSDCEGFGQLEFIIGRDFTPYLPKKRIEIFAADELVEIIFNTIMLAANTH